MRTTRRMRRAPTEVPQPPPPAPPPAQLPLSVSSSTLCTPLPQVLVARGFGFCDEGDEPEQPQFPAPSLDERHDCEPLLLEGVEASSTDAPTQGIGEALACPASSTSG